MTSTKMNQWLEANQHYLTIALARICSLLQASHDAPAIADIRAEWKLSAPPALESLRARFDLTDFETDVLLLCAGVELDSKVATLCAAAQGETGRTSPTFSTVLGLLPNPHCSALVPSAPLRYWHLIEVNASNLLTQSSLRINAPILHYLTGISSADDPLPGYLDPPSITTKPAPAPVHSP